MAELNTFRPATLSDLTKLCPVLPMKYWRGLAAQIASFPAFALDRDGEPVLIVSLVPDGAVIEACVIFPTGGRPPLSALRRLLLSAATVLPDRVIVARIDDGNAAGQRMAELVGFMPTDDVFAGSMRAWVRPALEAGNVTAAPSA